MTNLSIRAFACAVVLTALAPTQSQSGGPFETGVRFVNTTTSERHEWGLATVPFPQGVFRDGDTFGVLGHPGELRPFGLRWPDGSVRFAQLAVFLGLSGGEQRVVTVREGASPFTGPFEVSPWVAARLGSFGADLEIELPDGTVATAPIGGYRLLRSGASRIAFDATGRVPGTDFAFHFWIEFFHGQDNARFELRLTHSRLGSPNWETQVRSIRFVPRSVNALVRGATRLTVFGGLGNVSGPNPVELLRDTGFADGQAFEWWGDLLFFDPAVTPSDAAQRVSTFAAISQEPLFGVALNWRSSGAFGPFGYLSGAPPWMTDGGRSAAFDDRARFLGFYETTGDQWEDRPKALQPYAAATGNQHDFGVGKFLDTFVSGFPMGIEEARFVGGEEAQRPVHHLEQDGSIVRHDNHPGWIARNGRTHWSDSVSPDRLGKPYPDYAPRSITNGWSGKDTQHWSSISLSCAYLLTCSDSLGCELEHEAELYQASHTLPSERPGLVTNHIGNGRAIGRTLLSMSWNYLLRADQQLGTHMQARIAECILPQHLGLQLGGQVRPIKVSGPDARTIASGDWWSPWEESQAALGLEAAHQLLGSTEARAVAFTVAKNLVENGWRIDFDSTVIGFALRFLNDGDPLPVSWLMNAEHVRWAGEGFKEWALPATRFAYQYGLLYGEPLLAYRARLLLDHLEQRRMPPRSSLGWDTYGDWDSAR